MWIDFARSRLSTTRGSRLILSRARAREGTSMRPNARRAAQALAAWDDRLQRLKSMSSSAIFRGTGPPQPIGRAEVASFVAMSLRARLFLFRLFLRLATMLIDAIAVSRVVGAGRIGETPPNTTLRFHGLVFYCRGWSRVKNE